MRRTSRPLTASRRSITQRYLQASETMMLRVVVAMSAGASCPHAAAIRAGMSPGARKLGSSGSNSGTSPSTDPASRSSSS